METAMSSDTPAAQLARLKEQFPGWSFWQGEHTGDFWAAPPPGGPQGLLSAATVPELEALVREAESWRQ
jgi:hypothetical protein